MYEKQILDLSQFYARFVFVCVTWNDWNRNRANAEQADASDVEVAPKRDAVERVVKPNVIAPWDSIPLADIRKNMEENERTTVQCEWACVCDEIVQQFKCMKNFKLPRIMNVMPL